MNTFPAVHLDGRRLTSRKAFHDECKASFGFPECYGQNMDAWIDCLSGLRDDDGMSGFTLSSDEILTVDLLHADAVPPDILAMLEDGIAEVNERCAEFGEQPALKLVVR